MIPGAPGPRAALRPTLRLVANCDRGRGYVRPALRRSLFAVFVAQSLCRSTAPLGLPAQPHSQREPSSVTKTNRAPRQWRFRTKSSRLESDCPCFPSVSESVSEMKQRRRDGNCKLLALKPQLIRPLKRPIFFFTHASPAVERPV